VQPQPQPQPTYQPAPAYPAAPPPRHVRYREFIPTFELGGKLLTISTGGDMVNSYYADGTSLSTSDVAGGGLGFQADVGFHFHPQLSVYGFWEHDFLGRGNYNKSTAQDGSSGFDPDGNVVGVGMRWNSAPHHPIGFLLDVGFGYRWMDFPIATNGDANYNGAQSYAHGSASGGEVRFGIGMSIGPNPHMRIEPAFNFALGSYSSFSTDASCPAGSNCSFLDYTQRGSYWTAGVSIGAHFDLFQ
jgi:hypothetical protein